VAQRPSRQQAAKAKLDQIAAQAEAEMRALMAEEEEKPPGSRQLEFETGEARKQPAGAVCTAIAACGQRIPARP